MTVAIDKVHDRFIGLFAEESFGQRSIQQQFKPFFAQLWRCDRQATLAFQDRRLEPVRSSGWAGGGDLAPRRQSSNSTSPVFHSVPS